ncbi:Alpha/Beta hydrolase protein [Mortierella sp. GBAus27b]|nr:hypothetical protein BGX31_000080 [Mortierella sp. GBA43]KAI8360287.1 Alpha/Beta hydrolase protein [Mortierella sp. GBAus27b]
MKSLRVTLLAFAAIATGISTNPIPSSSLSHLVHEERGLLDTIGGYNNFNCKPSAKHPNPLVLVHGMAAGKFVWTYMGPRFASRGYCVFSLDYGRINENPFFGGMTDIMESAQELSDFVDKVLQSTGASKVDLLGHSEGTALSRVYLKYKNGFTKTGSVAAIGSIQYGTTIPNIITRLEDAGVLKMIAGGKGPVCKSCPQLKVNSTLLLGLNKEDEVYPDIKYLMLVSDRDQIVAPYTNGFLRTEGPNVHNVVLQDLCPSDTSEHFLQCLDPVVFRAVETFLSTGSAPRAQC